MRISENRIKMNGIKLELKETDSENMLKRHELKLDVLNKY